jgi:excisionase family DNA binding protein
MAEKKLEKRDFVTINNISNCCMVSPSTVRRWINEGKLSAFKLPGGHFRVMYSDLIDFLKKYDIPVPKELLEIVLFLNFAFWGLENFA